MDYRSLGKRGKRNEQAYPPTLFQCHCHYFNNYHFYYDWFVDGVSSTLGVEAGDLEMIRIFTHEREYFDQCRDLGIPFEKQRNYPGKFKYGFVWMDTEDHIGQNESVLSNGLIEFIIEDLDNVKSDCYEWFEWNICVIYNLPHESFEVINVYTYTEESKCNDNENVINNINDEPCYPLVKYNGHDSYYFVNGFTYRVLKFGESVNQVLDEEGDIHNISIEYFKDNFELI